MTRSSRIWNGLAALLALILVGQLARLAGRTSVQPIEPGESGLFELEAASRSFLAQLDEEVLLTYYASPQSSLPTHARHLREEVGEVLEGIRAAAPDRIHVEWVVPEEQPELAGYLTELGLSSFRARSLLQDGWSEAEIWSSLRISCGARGEATLHAVTPELLPGLGNLVIEHLRCMQAPEPPLPHVALAVPGNRAADYSQLADVLGDQARVTRLDLDAEPESLPPDVDLLFWMEPSRADSSSLELLDRHLRSGRPAILATAPLVLTGSQAGSEATDALLAHQGVVARAGVLTDSNRQTGVTGPLAEIAIRCIAHDQDFRSLGRQPNGDLTFTGARGLTLDGQRLQERNRTAHVLASTSSAGRLRATADANGTRLTPGPRRHPLLLLLESEDLFRGKLVVAASSSLFQNEAQSDPLGADRGLVRLLVKELASPEQVIWNRAAPQPFEPLAPLSSADRASWRVRVVLLIPGLLGLLALFRARKRGAGMQVSRIALRVAAPAVALAVVVSLAGVASWTGSNFDWTRDSVHELGDEELALARLDVKQKGTLECIFSDASSLPPELRLPVKRAVEYCEALAAGTPGLVAVRTRPEQASDSASLPQATVTSTLDETTRTRRITAAIRIRVDGREEILPFEEAQDFEHLRFRIGFALHRLRSGRTVRVAVAAAPSRLSAAEDELDYRAEGLFAPTEGDRFASARRLLERNDFELIELDPGAPELTGEADLVLWLQPRRDVTPMMKLCADRLAGGGSVLLAAQHYEVTPRQLRRNEMELSFWPRPLHTDLETGYLADLGLELVKEIYFDRETVPFRLATRVERDLDEALRGQQVEAQFAAQPFVLRALASSFDDSAPMRGVEDLLLPSANRVRFLPSKLKGLEEIELRARPLALSSGDSWKLDWKGGDLPDKLLRGPRSPEESLAAAPQALAMEVVGRFPSAFLEEEKGADGTVRQRIRASRAPGDTEGDTPGDTEGRLLLLGSSLAWSDDVLANPEFGNGALLLNSVVHLTLGPELTQVVGRRTARVGFQPPAPDQRILWRFLILGSSPLAGLILALGIFALRRS